eukprot:Lankesteria_metandrocarpae@DN1481_c0_g1_i1.p1
MEYEADFVKHRIRLSHSEFFGSKLLFREIIRCRNPLFAPTCHFVYRLTYIRDVVLPRHLDEASVQRLTSVINSGYHWLLRELVSDDNHMFTLVKEAIEHSVEGALFLKSLLRIVKLSVVNMDDRNSMVLSMKLHEVLTPLEGYLTGRSPAFAAWRRDRALLRTKRIQRRDKPGNAEDPDSNIIDSIYFTGENSKYGANYIQSDDSSLAVCHEDDSLDMEDDLDRFWTPAEVMTFGDTVVSLAVEILSYTTELAASLLVRDVLVSSSMLNRESSPTFWLALCDVLAYSENCGTIQQVTEAFNMVLNLNELEATYRDEILEIFYDRGVMSRLIEIISSVPPSNSTQARTARSFAEGQIMGVIAVCIEQHQSRMAFRAMQYRLPRVVLERALNNQPFDKFLAIHAIKLLKRFFQFKEEFYVRHLVKTDVLRPVFQIFERHVKRPASRIEGSLLESVFLDLFAVILAAADCPSRCRYVQYLGDSYYDQLVVLNQYYCKVCRFDLLTKVLDAWSRHRGNSVHHHHHHHHSHTHAPAGHEAAGRRLQL